jgi:hypothetical protein
MSSHSRYDHLHDKYHQIFTTKAGTRYERLAALVFKALEEKHAVIHDLKLAGADPEVQHQIDVTVEITGTKKRLLIECKDFDVSGDKVGLDILRSFRSVIEDTQADEGIVITCNGFTDDAQKYARSKGIKLAVLRLFETRDMEGRIIKVIVGLIVLQPSNPVANIHVKADVQPQYAAALAAIGAAKGVMNGVHPVYFVRSGERQHFNDFLSTRINAAVKPAGGGAIRIVIPPDGWRIQVDQNPPFEFDGIEVIFDVDEQKHTIEVTSKHIAELVLSGFGTNDIIIFDHQIKGHLIDPETGKLV